MSYGHPNFILGGTPAVGTSSLSAILIWMIGSEKI